MPRSSFTHTYRDFRLRLVEARKDAKLTQTAVAKRLGKPQSYVSKYERGERRLDVIEFVDVARALRLDPVRFLREIVNDFD